MPAPVTVTPGFILLLVFVFLLPSILLLILLLPYSHSLTKFAQNSLTTEPLLLIIPIVGLPTSLALKKEVSLSFPLP